MASWLGACLLPRVRHFASAGFWSSPAESSFWAAVDESSNWAQGFGRQSTGNASGTGQAAPEFNSPVSKLPPRLRQIRDQIAGHERDLSQFRGGEVAGQAVDVSA